ncbi:MAG: SGNH/GDSL hydrolase family protein [Pseudorhodobacter sp.]|nr:SGNH/GDSL hydrolase family protein [Rhizobacter sp.]
MSLTFKLLSSPLWVTQALLIRSRTPLLPEAQGERSGEVGDGALLRVLIVGDSSAAGVGVATQRQAFSGYLTRALAKKMSRRVRWNLVARSGISSAQALAMVQQAAPAVVDVAVVLLGVNDVIEQLPSRHAVAHREQLADWLISQRGARHVMFSPLPPMGEFPVLRPPLRWIVRADAQRHDRALAQWAATRSDVWHVPIAIKLSAAGMAADGFHAGEPVYKVCGEAVADFISKQLREPAHTTPSCVTTKLKP